MAEDTRADAESHFVNGLDYLISYLTVEEGL